jgi:hypothetical protein
MRECGLIACAGHRTTPVSPVKARASWREPPQTADTLTGELRRDAPAPGQFRPDNHGKHDHEYSK